MAAESSRSGASSADSYIGSLISLTSKSEIRYEGILCNINTDESSIGLRNVQSFGTEGRKKDGPQIPASDKIYEYILFRGSDIKDLQVKSSPPAQSASIHNDPAIIQSHYSRPTSTSSSLPSVGGGNVADISSQTAQLGLPRSTFQGSLPLYQPGGGLGSWASSPAPPNANVSGIALPPVYWQGYYAPSGGLTHLQQPTLLRPPPGLPIPHSMQQPLQYSGMNSSLPSGSQNLPEFPSPLFPPVVSMPNLTPSSLSSTLAPSSTSALANETSSAPLLIKSSVTSLPASTLSVSLPLVPPLTTNLEPIATLPQTTPVISSKPNMVTGPALAYQSSLTQSAPQSVPAVAGSSSSSQAETSVPLVTPGQLLQTGSSTVPSSQPLPTSHKDADARTLEVKTKPLLPDLSTCATPETKEPILPLPKPTAPTVQKPNGAASHAYYNSGHGSGRGRGNGYARPVTRFTEDFDFIAMNEKFNKDEVWGHLGKSKAHLKDKDAQEDEADEFLEENEEESLKLEIKPVYVKDDFFDSLSSNTADRGIWNGRTKFSERLKIDAETFGNISRHRPNRGGGRGPRGGGRFRGSYHGSGHGYVGRGRGHAYSHRGP